MQICLKKAGVTIPETWDELIEVCEKLSAAGIQPFELSFKDSWTILPSWNSLAPATQPESFLEAKKEGTLLSLALMKKFWKSTARW